jgi:hypothetical protein
MNKKQFLIENLINGGLTSTQLINKWIFNNEKEFLKRISIYIKQGKEKIGETKFTKNQIRAELISIINKNPKIFTNEIIIQYFDTNNANFRIITDKVYLLK